MRIEIRQKKGQEPLEAITKALKILKRKTAGDLRLLRDRNRGFKKPSLIKHEKIRDILHKRKLKKRSRNKRWKK